MNNIAKEWAAELAKNEGEAFEKALTRIKPSTDELEQAFRLGYIAGRSGEDERLKKIAVHLY